MTKLIHTPKSRRDSAGKPPSTEQVMEWITAGSLAAAQKMYTQLTQETERINAEYRMELEEQVAKLGARIAALEAEPRQWFKGDPDGARL